MKSPVLSTLSFVCLSTLSAFSLHAESEPEPTAPFCTSDQDCAPDEYCAWVAPAICHIDEDTGDCLPPDDSELTGFCTRIDVPDDGSCVSDADCAEGFYCETVGATCDLSCEPEEECEFFCDDYVEEQEGHCVEIFGNTECFDDTDCGPDGWCNPDGTCYEWGIIEPQATCFSDEDCGAGGYCVLPEYDCPPGAACMIPAIAESGYCEYMPPPVDDQECVVAVYDECVLYAGNGSEMSCDATSGAPTWLAFLALLGLVRRHHRR